MVKYGLVRIKVILDNTHVNAPLQVVIVGMVDTTCGIVNYC